MLSVACSIDKALAFGAAFFGAFFSVAGFDVALAMVVRVLIMIQMYVSLVSVNKR
jgi:hypothetical protein